MKKLTPIIFISFLIFACNKKISEADINNLNGYWEIEKVIFADGSEKKYSINETFDYFDVKNNKGFRKKVMPQLDGTFIVNEGFEKINIKKEKEKYFIYYTTDFAKWKEELRFVSEEELVLINKTKKEYHYKKAAPINILENGEKTK